MIEHHTIGPVHLYLADNMDLIPQFEDGCFDWLIDDPPYGIKEDHWRQSRKVKAYGAVVRVNEYPREVWKQPVPTQEYFDQVMRVSKNQIIWGINYFVGLRSGLNSPGRIVWNKVNGESNWSDCEIAYCSAHHTTRMFEFMWSGMMQGESMLHGKKMRANKKQNQKRIHDTEKPIELYKWTIHKYVKPGSSILDCHGGSMSLLAAVDYFNKFHNYDLKVTVIEKDEQTFRSAMKRFVRIYSQSVANFDNVNVLEGVE